MIHGGHRTRELEGLTELRATVRRFRPEVVLAEDSEMLVPSRAIVRDNLLEGPRWMHVHETWLGDS